MINIWLQEHQATSIDVSFCSGWMGDRRNIKHRCQLPTINILYQNIQEGSPIRRAEINHSTWRLSRRALFWVCWNSRNYHWSLNIELRLRNTLQTASMILGLSRLSSKNTKYIWFLTIKYLESIIFSIYSIFSNNMLIPLKQNIFYFWPQVFLDHIWGKL